ncbi:MAG: sulfite exporter TauE/SafE family protein [Phycisphaerales bacterium]|jgi:hypothetical protein
MMLALVLAILAASLLGSLHCAGMCGGFLAMAVSPLSEGEARRVAPWRLNASYNLGRLATYVLLGVMAGAVGKGFELAGELAGVQRAAAVFAGGWMVAFGSVLIARSLGARLPRLPLPRALKTIVMRGHDAADRLGPLGRASVIGLLTTMLPCGWLYAFAVTASGTADPVRGGVVMAAFWLGTLPVMASLGVALQRSLGPVRRAMPLTTAVVLVVMGGLTLAGRVRAISSAGETLVQVVCH